ncbi:MAG: sigma factor, partial [Pseudomonadota bacterium]
MTSEAVDAAGARARLDATVRRERGRLIAALAARLGGPGAVDLAEDVAQDAIVAALETWAYKGAPDDPGAWLAVVARRKAIDRLRRSARHTGFDPDAPPTDLD